MKSTTEATMVTRRQGQHGERATLLCHNPQERAFSPQHSTFHNPSLARSSPPKALKLVLTKSSGTLQVERGRHVTYWVRQEESLRARSWEGQKGDTSRF